MKERPGRIRAATIDTVRQSSAHVRVLQRNVSVGPVAVSDITFLTDTVVECDDVGSGYYAHLPISGRLESRHGGSKLTATREVAAVYSPGGGALAGQWAGGGRGLGVVARTVGGRWPCAVRPARRRRRRYGSGPAARPGTGAEDQLRAGHEH